jgi:hypothetical protein
MAAIDRFILLVRDLRRNESGIAVPTALMALIATFALASVTVMSTVDVQRGTTRDHASKEAIAAADAGASIAMLRLNRYLPSMAIPGGPTCVSSSGLSQTPAASGWCPKTTPEKIGAAEVTYQVSTYGTSKEVQVVAWGSSGGVTRRVDVGLKAIDGKNVFADEKVIGEEGIEFKGSAADIYTDMGTNGEITSTGGSHPTLCGNGRHGIGKKEVPPLSCGGIETEGNMILPPVFAPANVEQDDCRLLPTAPSGCSGTDVYTAKNNAKRSETVPWYVPKKELTLDNNSALTLGGHNYLVCKLVVEGGKLYMPFNTEVNIYIDTPEKCNLAPGSVQLAVLNNGEILSSAFNPSQESYAIPNIYLLGESKVYLKGNPSNVSSEKGATSNEIMIYGPKSTIEFDGSATWKGMVAGKKVIIQGNGRIESSSKFKLPEKNLQPLFERQHYVECTGTTTATSAPNTNC